MKKTLLYILLSLSINGLMAQTTLDTEPGNNNAPGDSLGLPINNNATITNTNDVDYFKIETNKIGVLNIAISGTNNQLQTRILLYNSDGKTLEGYRDAVFAGDDINTEFLTQYVGVYYIKIQNIKSTSTASPYNMKVTMDSSDIYELNNSFSSMAAISPISVSYNESFPTKINAKIQGYYYVSNGGNYDYNSLTADQDIYKITTGSRTGVLNMRLNPVPGNLRFRMELVKDDGTTLLGYRDAGINGDSLSFEMLTQYSGTYYLRIRNINGIKNGSGNTSASPYTLSMALDTSGGEFNDNIGAISLQKAINISLQESSPTNIKGKIRGFTYVNNGGLYDFANLTADQDYYKISTGNSRGVLVMNLVGVPTNLKFRIEVLKDDGITPLGYRDANFNGDTLRLELLTQYAGTYYLRLRNTNGSTNGSLNTSLVPYSIDLSLDTLGNELNDNVSAINARVPVSVSLNEASPNVFRGKIRGFYYVNNGGKYDLASLTADQDYYKVTTKTNNGILVMKLASVPSNLRFRIEVLKDDGVTSLGYRDAGINGDTLRFELLAEYAGTYFIKLLNVNGASNGLSNSSAIPYTLQVSLDTIGAEFNNNIIAIASLSPVNISLNESNPTRFTDKIRGYYYVNNGGNYSFAGLTADQDYFKVTTGPYKGVMAINLSKVPANLRLRIELIKDDGITPLGFRDATINGDTSRFELLTDYGGIYYIRIYNINGASNGSSNSSSNTYTMDVSMDTLGNEFNDNITAISGAAALNIGTTEINPTIVRGKIRGYYYVNNGGNYTYTSLTADQDFYKINTGSQNGVLVMKLTNVAPNLRYRIELFKEDGTTSLGYRDAAFNGDSLKLEILLQTSGIHYIRIRNINGVANGIGNTSSIPYNLSLFIENGWGEFNNEIVLATPLKANDTIQGKIRGHYRFNFGTTSGSDFNSLITDADFYKINDGCYHFEGAIIDDVPLNMRLRITAYDTSGNFILGSKSSTVNGERVVMTIANLTKTNIVRYLRVDNINSGNDNNTGPGSYKLSTIIKDTLYHPNISPRQVKPCADSVVSFTSSSIDNNRWGSGETSRTINKFVTKSDIVTLRTATTGCYSGIDTAYILLQTKPVPLFTYSTSGRNVSFTNLSPTATTFKWNYGVGKAASALANPSYTYQSDGTFIVLLIVSNACGTDSIRQPVIVNSAGINTGNSERALIIPNPNKGNFTVQFKQILTENTNLYLYNSVGQQVYQQEINSGSNKTVVNAELPEGVYFMSLNGSFGKSMQKVVIQH